MITTGNGIFDAVTPERLPMIQYSIEASCFSGSAMSFKSMRTVCARAWTAIPARTMEEWSRTGERAVSPRERQTARRAPKNAKSVVDGAAAETNRIAKAAPALAPEETPMMSGDASGFRKTVW